MKMGGFGRDRIEASLGSVCVCVYPVFAVVRPDDVIHVQSVVFNHSRGIL